MEKGDGEREMGEGNEGWRWVSNACFSQKDRSGAVPEKLHSIGQWITASSESKGHGTHLHP